MLIRTRSPIVLVTGMILMPYLPYAATLPYSHNADDGSSKTEDNIGDCVGGVGRG